MADILNFSSDNVNVFLMVVDASGSMEMDEYKICKGLENYKKEFEDFYGADSIAVAVSKFSDSYYKGEFKKVKDMDTDYYTVGYTALYYSIEQGKEQLKKYIREIKRVAKIIPRATFIFWSDGKPCEDPGTYERAKEAIAYLNKEGVTTVFVAFGEAISSKFGEDLGFSSTIQLEDRDAATDFLGKELSKSCKEQVKSVKALGSNFFSKAKENKGSAGYSKTTEEVLENDDWIDSI